MSNRSVGYWFGVYRAEFTASLNSLLQYRAAMAIWLIEMVIEPVIYLVVWSAVATARGGEVGGYQPANFAAYFIVFMLINHITYSWTMWVFEDRIRSGTLSAKLLRPIHPIHSDIALNLAYKLLTLVTMVVTAILLVILFRPAFAFDLLYVSIGLGAAMMGFLLRFLFEWALALLSFWTTRMTGITELYYVTLLFLAGQVAPLTLFPEPIQVVAHILPFKWMIAFPVEVTLGYLTLQQITTGIAIQLAWLGLSFVLLHVLWRNGLRRYSAVGG